ncbi:thioesterase family protein [Nonomuraea rhizosphaerae]|uniref:thioesterase family protein n=1 Tax=Nonomuraea rhizosphaerae TaxID=2665663 RepID=UPI001C5F0594|nr:thioesterase family protein [Nonomuraea rhizosphaerae]
MPDPFTTRVRDEWLDYNGHMNDACYALVCAQASEVLLDELGFGARYQEETGRTTYTVESRIRYLKEARAGETISVTSALVEATPKRLRVRHSLRAGGGDEIATAEFVYVHVNQATGRVEPMPPELEARARSAVRP